MQGTHTNRCYQCSELAVFLSSNGLSLNARGQQWNGRDFGHVHTR